MAVLFISDLHLEPGQPETVQRFVDFVAHRAFAAERLYILGDLFEAWIGDDDTDPGVRPIVDALTSLSRSILSLKKQRRKKGFTARSS